MQFQSLDASPADVSADAARRPCIDAFDLHPSDYALLQKAAALQGLQLVDFVTLAAYQAACDVLADDSAALFSAPCARKRQPDLNHSDASWHEQKNSFNIN